MGMRIYIVAFCLLALSPSRADVITRLPTSDRVVALTFDACEGWERVSFDREVLDFVLEQKIPVTLFVTGKFVQNNATDIARLSKLDFVDIENHSWDHPNTMNRFDPHRVVNEVGRAQQEIGRVTGKPPQFFRFPAGNFNQRGLKAVEDLGLKVVHWRWASGDPSHGETAARLFTRTMTNVEPGDVLIFHINGRGVHTAEALPHIVAALKEQGFRFVLVSDYVGRSHPHNTPAPDITASARSIFESLMLQVPLAGMQGVYK